MTAANNYNIGLFRADVHQPLRLMDHLQCRHRTRCNPAARYLNDPADPDTGFTLGIAAGYPKHKTNTDAADGAPSWITYSIPFGVSDTDTSVWAYAKTVGQRRDAA